MPYAQDGIVTQAKILRDYVEPNSSNPKRIKRFIDYEYFAQNKRYIFKHYNVTPDCRKGETSSCTVDNLTKSSWINLKPENTFDIFYLKQNPKVHHVLNEEHPFYFIFCSALLALILISSLKFFENRYLSQFEFHVSVAAILMILAAFNIYLSHYYKVSGFSKSISIAEINAIFISIALITLFNLANIWRQKETAVAQVYIQSMFRKPTSGLLSLYFYNLSYEFKDSSGKTHTGIFNPLVFFKPINHVGKTFTVMYPKQNPNRLIRLTVPR
ncbi:MAG: hypothetical protein U1E36_01365 [Rickettsiales bacterium]